MQHLVQLRQKLQQQLNQQLNQQRTQQPSQLLRQRSWQRSWQQSWQPLQRVAGMLAMLSVCVGPLACASPAPFVLSEPTSFVGTLPCADCPGIDWHLDLWPDGRFHLQRVYQERDGRDDDLGRWRRNPADASLLLFGGREAPLRLAPLEDGSLRLLDLEGRPIESSLPYELMRLPRFTSAPLSLTLAGEFRYFADAATFRECRSNHTYPVLMEGDYQNAERTYLAAQSGDEPLFLELEGQVLNRQVMDNEGPPQSLRIERLLSSVPGLRCERAMSEASLPNTYWRLLRLDDMPVTTPAGAREVHLVLHDAQQRVAGFAGCNRFTGAYELNGNRLAFAATAGTRMACPAPQMTLEQRFYAALSKIQSWRVAGQTLELYDANAQALMVYEAVYLP